MFEDFTFDQKVDPNTNQESDPILSPRDVCAQIYQYRYLRSPSTQLDAATPTLPSIAEASHHAHNARTDDEPMRPHDQIYARLNESRFADWLSQQAANANTNVQRVPEIMDALSHRFSRQTLRPEPLAESDFNPAQTVPAKRRMTRDSWAEEGAISPSSPPSPSPIFAASDGVVSSVRPQNIGRLRLDTAMGDACDFPAPDLKRLRRQCDTEFNNNPANTRTIQNLMETMIVNGSQCNVQSSLPSPVSTSRSSFSGFSDSSSLALSSLPSSVSTSRFPIPDFNSLASLLEVDENENEDESMLDYDAPLEIDPEYSEQDGRHLYGEMTRLRQGGTPGGIRKHALIYRRSGQPPGAYVKKYVNLRKSNPRMRKRPKAASPPESTAPRTPSST